MAANDHFALVIGDATILIGNTHTTARNIQIHAFYASLEGLLTLAAAMRGPGLTSKFEQAMDIFNDDWADTVGPQTRRWAFNRWRSSEEECHLFLLMRHQERRAYFEDQMAYFEN